MIRQQAQQHPDFIDAQKLIYKPLGWTCTDVQKSLEGQEYGACTFQINNRAILFRVAKVTPTKVGQFVTIWKRIGNGPTMAYDSHDPFDLMVINVRTQDHFGQFVFPKAVLVEKGIVSKNGVGGKRGIRVYPAWDVTDNPQAKKTQAWQLDYFFEVSQAQLIDQSIVERLFL